MFTYPFGDRLMAGQSMTRNQGLLSTCHSFKLLLQSDKQLVLYGPGGQLWAVKASEKEVRDLQMQEDGNLVVYDIFGQPGWNTQTGGKGSPNSYAELRIDAMLLVQSQDGANADDDQEFAVWFSDAIHPNMDVNEIGMANPTLVLHGVTYDVSVNNTTLIGSMVLNSVPRTSRLTTEQSYSNSLYWTQTHIVTYSIDSALKAKLRVKTPWSVLDDNIIRITAAQNGCTAKSVLRGRVEVGRATTLTRGGENVVQVKAPPKTSIEAVASVKQFRVFGVPWTGTVQAKYEDGSIEDFVVQGMVSGLLCGDVEIMEIQKDLKGNVVSSKPLATD